MGVPPMFWGDALLCAPDTGGTPMRANLSDFHLKDIV